MPGTKSLTGTDTSNGTKGLDQTRAVFRVASEGPGNVIGELPRPSGAGQQRERAASKSGICTARHNTCHEMLAELETEFNSTNGAISVETKSPRTDKITCMRLALSAGTVFTQFAVLWSVFRKGNGSMSL